MTSLASTLRSALPAGHRRHAPSVELYGGVAGTPFERPERIDSACESLERAGFPASILEQIHHRDYLSFLQHCWSDWQRAGFDGDAIANVWPARRHRQVIPRNIEGRIGYYAFACETSITAGTWEAAQESAYAALTAQAWVADGEAAALALCRPPGHHAGKDFFGGYCFLNNAALSATQFLRQGASRVAILDVDFHHGNGTQDIFYDRGDVMYASIHGDPAESFPFFMGHADETGEGMGADYTLNYPLNPGDGWDAYLPALEDVLGRIRVYGPDALIVSLGVDAYAGDPICFLRLQTDDFRRIGRQLKTLARPTLFVLEGGYDIPCLGDNVVATLRGFLGD